MCFAAPDFESVGLYARNSALLTVVELSFPEHFDLLSGFCPRFMRTCLVGKKFTAMGKCKKLPPCGRLGKDLRLLCLPENYKNSLFIIMDCEIWSCVGADKFL